jgi:hypothetical protein
MKTKLFYFLMCLFALTATNAQITSVAIVGAGIEPNGWPTQSANPGPIDKYQMTQVGTTDVWQITGLVMVGGDVKFRANNSWNDATGSPAGGNWGKPATGSAFPTAIAVNAGSSSNIPAVAGTYDITINVVTGEYNFAGGPPIAVVKLFGTATNPPSGIFMSTADGIIYDAPANTVLLAGNAQFDVDGTVVGALAFPSGTATGVATDFIPVPAGKYTSITYNNGDGTYTFVAAPLYNSLAIVGDGAGGWPGDPGNPGPIDVNQMTTTDGIIYTIKNVPLTVGGIKFRQNNNWSDTNWTGNAFPFGILQVPGSNIAVSTAGNYDCIVNVVTGVYRFNLSSQPPVSIVGAGAGGWPGGTTPTPDTNVMNTIDGENYTLTNLVLTAGEIKFRQDYAWANSWGGTAFPTGSPSSSNLVATAGTFDVTFTRSTGAYTFTTSALAVKNFNAGSFKVYPNPAKTSWNITSNDDITSVQVYDMLGKSVYAKTASSKEVTVNAADLSKGVYFAKVSTANGSSTVKLIKE